MRAYRGKVKSRNLVSDDKNVGRKRNKRSFKQKTRNSRLGIYGAAGTQLMKDVRYLMSVINVEDKYVDNNATATLSGAWQISLLNGLLQGTNSSQRMGQSVKVIGVEFRYTLANNAAATLPVNVRVVLARDKQANTAAPTFTNIYPVDVTAPRVVGYLERFTLDVEECTTLDNVGTQGIYRSHVFRDQWHIQFNSGNAGTIADIVTNSYYIGYVCDATINFPSITYTCRVIYVDN